MIFVVKVAVEGGHAGRGGDRLPLALDGPNSAAHGPRRDLHFFAADGELDGAEQPLAGEVVERAHIAAGLVAAAMRGEHGDRVRPAASGVWAS